VKKKMKRINVKNVVCGVSLGTVMMLGSMSSAFAADINRPTDPAYKVELQQHVKLLTEEQAKAIALKQFKGVVKDIQLTKENGKDVYVIVIHDQDGKDRTVKVDLSTGSLVLVNFTQDQAKDIALKQYKGDVKDDQLNKENGKDVYVFVIHDQDGKDRTVKVDPSTGSLVDFTQDQAKNIALNQYKGDVKDIRLNKENGKDVYVAVIHGQDGKDHTVKVDPITGSLVKLTQDEVKVIALKQYAGSVKDVQLNNENGRDVYKISIHDQKGKDHEVKIDANTGEIC
jgi:uncharacterized membrane protein YkoI